MQDELLMLIEALRKGGATALAMARDGFEVRRKPDGSPVTTADLAVNQILHESIANRFPDDGWLSEESPDDESRLRKKRVWIVDPIDGTKAFVDRASEFCISAALIEDGVPLVGAIFNPSTGELFSAVRGSGLQVNGQPVCEHGGSRGGAVVLANPWELKMGRFRPILQEVECRPMRSIAYALAQVAVNRAAATVTFEPEHEWDLAAGVLLIQEAGGVTGCGPKQRPVRFNQPQTSCRGLFALAPGADPSIGRALRRFYAAHYP